MKLTIRLPYHTRFGQTIFLSGDHPWFGGGQQESARPLRYVNEECWEATLDLPDTERPEKPVSYYFLVRQPDGSVVEDFGGDRKLRLGSLPAGHTIILDTWTDLGAVENVFSTEPFKNVLLPSPKEPPDTKSPTRVTHEFRVKAPLLPKDQVLCLLGGSPALGGWNESAPILLRRDPEIGGFIARLDLSNESFPVAYKYGVYDVEKGAFVRYEEGANRVLAEAAPPDGRVLLHDGRARVPATLWRGAGVSIPVFSLQSQSSFGVGDFLDLRPLADWARRAGLKLIQILPVNDTSATHSWSDSYPYAAISAFALHPLYLNLDALAGPRHQSWLDGLALQRQQLNQIRLDYMAVMNAKLAFAREMFPVLWKKNRVSAEYRDFFSQNEHWLTPYAAFCFLRDKFGTSDFNLWPEHRVYDEKKIQALARKDAAARDEMAFHIFLQFHLHTQLRAAVDYVHAQGLILKGDIAIGVRPHSVEVWQQPELFYTDMQAGAPPDAFAAKGQNWGFPTYRWPRMKQDGFAWWKSRFAQMSCYFDAFRIDHILGFFRIWSIPSHAVEGILGYFVPAVPVREEEFAARGIVFDKDRFTRPFITDDVLREMFGGPAPSVQKEFLEPIAPGRYALKPAFTTQRDVERHFASLDIRDARLKERLFDLISNVLLIEDPGGGYHFRLGMEQTSSFRQLDPDTQSVMKDLLEDYFFQRQEAGWRREAMEKLPALKRVTNMLICGEDLGMVPECVPGVMQELGLVVLEVQRMPKGSRTEFSRPAEASYLTVVTPGTHDMSTIRGWWLEDKQITQKFYNQELRQIGQAPAECEPSINRLIVRQHLESPAIWSIFQLQDLLGMDAALRFPDPTQERINVPADSRHYWRYRMHLSLETLIHEEQFTQLVETMVRQSGR